MKQDSRTIINTEQDPGLHKRFYRITLSIGAGYKNNYIIMERLV